MESGAPLNKEPCPPACSEGAGCGESIPLQLALEMADGELGGGGAVHSPAGQRLPFVKPPLCLPEPPPGVRTPDRCNPTSDAKLSFSLSCSRKFSLMTVVFCSEIMDDQHPIPEAAKGVLPSVHQQPEGRALARPASELLKGRAFFAVCFWFPSLSTGHLCLWAPMGLSSSPGFTPH